MNGIGPGANGVALDELERNRFIETHAQELVAAEAARLKAANENIEANDKARKLEKSENQRIAEEKATKILDNHPRKFKKGDIVKLKMSEITRKDFDFTKPRSRVNPRVDDLDLRWVVKSWDGAIGIVSSDKVSFKYPMNPKPEEYKYEVKVQRLSGGSEYNPILANQNPDSLPFPVDENILEIDMELITLTEEQKAADDNNFRKAWRVVPIALEKSISTSGGKRRSKSRNKPKKSAKRSKSRRTRRQRK